MDLSTGAVVVRAGRGRRLLHHDRPGAGRRVARVHDQTSRKQAEAVDPAAAGSRWRSFSVAGFSFSGAAPNQGLMFVRLKDFRRAARAETSRWRPCSDRIRGPLLGGIPGALVIPVAPPAIQGLSHVRRIPVRGARRSRAATSRTWPSVTGQMIAQGQRSRARSTGLYTQLHGERPAAGRGHRSRSRRAASACRFSEVTDALQVLLGSQYVNDFDFNNRAYRVYVQADQQFRAQPADLRQFYARASNGQMVPLDAVVRLQRDDGAGGHQPLQPVPVRRDHRRRRCPASARARRLQTMEELAARDAAGRVRASRGRGSRSRRSRPARRPVYIFALSIVLVYLVLAAQYESWMLPFIILLGVPLAVFGALGAQLLRGFVERRLLPGRPRHADRAGGEELDPDRRVRRAVARARATRSSTRRSRPRASGCGRS